MGKRNIRALLFDIGGTLYRNDTFDAEFPKQITELLARRLQVPLANAKIQLKKRQAELLAKEGDSSKVRAMATFGVSRTEVHEAFGRVEPKLFLHPEPAVAKALERLALIGVRMAILSNFRSVLVQKILKCLRLDLSIFEFALTEDDHLPIKPSREPFEEAIRRFGITPSMIGYVGDSLDKDIIPAKAVGMTTFWVHKSRESHPSADWALLSVTELPDCVVEQQRTPSPM
jgi:putative hydrolase of the HAD superfamily